MTQHPDEQTVRHGRGPLQDTVADEVAILRLDLAARRVSVFKVVPASRRPGEHVAVPRPLRLV